MKKILTIIIAPLMIFNIVNAEEWKILNKWKISCGLTDKDGCYVHYSSQVAFGQ